MIFCLFIIAVVFFLLIMKSFFRAGVVFFTVVLLAGVFSGCAQDESTAVKTYNNNIVQIQKDMFSKAQDASKIFDQQHLDPPVILLTLQGIQANINTSHDKFKAMPVPHGAEQLSDAMERFFQVEMSGIQNILGGVQQIQGKENDPTALKVFSDTFVQFSSQENSALIDFYATQQLVANQYGQQVIQTDQTQALN